MTFRSSSERGPVLRYVIFAADETDLMADRVSVESMFMGSADTVAEAWGWQHPKRTPLCAFVIVAVFDIETGQFVDRPAPPPPVLESDDDFRRRLIKDAGSVVVNNLMTASGAALDDLARRYFSPSMTRKVLERP